jgi:NDP-sugar pyrophosphorylase family protein
LEAIILCGGSSWRLKPDIWIPKPKIQINGETLISHHVKWLKRHGIDRIILATDTPNLLDDQSVVYSIEEKKLGTGGAVKKAVGLVKESRVYVMNVDDLVFYDPRELYEYSDKGAAILLSKPKLPFGRIHTQDTYILRFEQKPILDIYVSAGHYVFKKQIIEKHFPDTGDMELQTLQNLADKRILRGYRYNGLWLTINTMKELVEARNILGRSPREKST